MHNEDLINLSKARIDHAKDCLKESDILLSAGEYKGAANRAYYAAFHSMRAVLILDEFDSKKTFRYYCQIPRILLKNRPVW